MVNTEETSVSVYKCIEIAEIQDGGQILHVNVKTPLWLWGKNLEYHV